MRFIHYLLLFLLGLSAALIISVFVSNPGYMDAEYYYTGGRELASGNGFNEMILWNYLDDPAALPHPSHGYWMPLTSLVAAAGMAIMGELSFNAGRLGFILAAACLPVMTAALACSFRHKLFDGMLAGILAIFSGFYAAYWVTTDAFVIYTLLGGGILLIMGWITRNQKYRLIGYLGLGALCGLLYLTRVDGLVWLLVILGGRTIAWLSKRNRVVRQTSCEVQNNFSRLVLELVVLVSGFALVTSWWFVRNFEVFGSIFAPGGWRVLWLTEYDELFTYPATSLNLSHWLESGWVDILQARRWAIGQNLQTFIAVQGAIILLPLILAGIWHYRHESRVRYVTVIWLSTCLLMSLVLPFVGARGGFFHAGAAVQPLFWAMVPIGFGRFIHWGEKKRGWQYDKAQRGFGVILLASVGVLTGIITFTRVIGPDLSNFRWGESEREYTSLHEQLSSMGIGDNEIVMVNNPPGYYAATGQPAIVIPYGEVETLLDVGYKYNAQYVILERNHPYQLDGLYEKPGEHPGLEYFGTFKGTHIFGVE